MKFKLEKNLPASSAALLADAGYDVGTVGQEGLSGAPDPDVVAAAAAAGRVLISLDVGLGDIRAYPPGSHAGIVALRLTDQSAAAASKAVTRPGRPRQRGRPGRSSISPAARATANPPSWREQQVRELLKCGPPRIAFNQFAADAPDPPDCFCSHGGVRTTSRLRRARMEILCRVPATATRACPCKSLLQ